MLDSHVLVVDDDRDFVDSLAELLESRGYSVTPAASGEEGLARLSARPVDLVLLDMKMPGMNGMQCLAAMRRLRPGVDVVMVTAFTRGEMVRQALVSGVVAVMSKPVPVEELLGTIANITTSGAVLLVDDRQHLTDALRPVLTSAGCQVTVAASLAEARSALSRLDFDLVIPDYRLPDGTGVELVAWLQEAQRREPVILVTGYPDAALADLPCLFADDILTKPFEAAALIALLANRRARRAAAYQAIVRCG